jgi:hypothetical protein
MGLPDCHMEAEMSTPEQWLRIGLEFDSDVHQRDLDQVASTLQSELASSEVTVAVSIAPEAFDPGALGPILLLAASTSLPLAQTAKLLAPKLLRAMSGWLGKDRRRHVKVRMGQRVLELADATPQEQQRLVEAFIAATEPRSEGRTT